ncbi:MAG: hypothetical protein KGH88_03400 [Thaumarchaeota archaeon]|nr:hypothetical protein [Nitrososphaerota archaeon]
MTIIPPKNQKHQNRGIDEAKPRCHKCGSKNILNMGERGDTTLSCLDCDYTEGVGVD